MTYDKHDVDHTWRLGLQGCSLYDRCTSPQSLYTGEENYIQIIQTIEIANKVCLVLVFKFKEKPLLLLFTLAKYHLTQ